MLLLLLLLNGSLRSSCAASAAGSTCVSIFHEHHDAALRCTAMAMVVQQIELIQENGIIKHQERAERSALNKQDGNNGHGTGRNGQSIKRFINDATEEQCAKG